MRKQCAETYKKQYRMITYCLHQMLILQHASLFQICNAVTISSEIKSLPFHAVAPNLHEKRRPSDKMKRHGNQRSGNTPDRWHY